MQALVSRPNKHLHEVYSLLNENLSLLTELLPPSKVEPQPLKLTLSKSTFIKPNKAAFQDTAYYLLYCINPELTKEKLTSWPIIHSKAEHQFRNELTSCLIKINALFKGCDIPISMSSHFAAPGGYKIAYLLFKMSQLAMVQLLQKSGVCDVLLANKIIDSQSIEDLKLVTMCIENETHKELEKIPERQIELMQNADVIVKTTKKVHQDVAILKRQLEKKLSASDNNVVTEKILEQLGNQVKQVVELEQHFIELQNMAKCVENLIIEHKQPDILDLNSYFTGKKLTK